MAQRIVTAFTALLAFIFVAVEPCAAQLINFRIGNPNARVTIIEYAAITCPFCRNWDQTIWPDLYRRYVKTGIANFELRESLAPEAQMLGEEAFIVARCAAANDGYFQSVDAFMRTMPLQNDFEGRGWLISGGRAGGLAEWQVTACIGDPRNWNLFEQLKNMNMAALDAYGRAHNRVLGLPSVFVNGTLVDDPLNPGTVARAIEDAR